MARSREDIKRLLVSLLPSGSEQLYATENTDYIGGTLWSLAGALKETVTDRVDQLRLEVNPSTIVEMLPAWEAATGLANSVLAKFGAIAQRRNAVLSVLREHGSFSLDDIRSAVQPYFLYQNPDDIEIVETDRAALAALHTYVGGMAVAGGPVTSAASSVTVLDDPRVSPAGAIVNISIDGYLDEIFLRLEAPDGRVKDWPPGFLGSGLVSGEIFTLYAREMAGARIRGAWTLIITTGSSGGGTLNGWNIYVEGLGVILDTAIPPNRIGEGLGAAMFQFGVVADPSLLGPGYDLDGALKAIQKVKPAHTFGTLLYPNVNGTLCPIPDDPPTIPDRVIPC